MFQKKVFDTSVMRTPYSSPITHASVAMFAARSCCAGLAAFLLSCSPALPLQHEPPPAGEAAYTPHYSIVCVIHGDGDYLYHDTAGTERLADLEALAGAKRIAEGNPRAEVFVFHQRAKKHLLFIFPLPDGDFSYYRNGLLVAQESYWRDQEHSQLAPEVELFHRFRSMGKHASMNVFLYCGHEIPEFGGAGYDESYPKRTFTVRDLAVGLNGFTRDDTTFDLMVLSTCFGGTPYTIETLGTHARYIIASPDNLHLSYFDLHVMERLDLSMGDGDVEAFARKFAHQAFNRLTRDIQTAVSVGVYDMVRVQGFVRSVRTQYDQTLTVLGGETAVSGDVMKRCDCADLPGYRRPSMKEGVEILFRPAQFGRFQTKRDHSGWECWDVKGPGGVF
jgi:hypothetical protein